MNIRQISKVLAVVLTIASMTTGWSQVDKRVVLTSVDEMKAVNIFVDLKEDVPYSVSLIDNQGYTVWKQDNQRRVFAKSVLLEDMPEGTYRVLVSSDERYFQNTFTLNDGKTVIGKEQTHVFGPTISVLGSAVLVDFDSNKTRYDVGVKIYTPGGTEVFANAITTDDKRITRYDMSTLPIGTYDFVFDIEGKTFMRTVRLK